MISVIKMKKKYKQQLSIAVIFLVIVIISLFSMHSLYSFHTYDDIVYYDYLLDEDTKNMKVENFEIFKDENISSIGGGTLTIENKEIFSEGTSLKVSIIASDDKQQSITTDYSIVYSASQSNYLLETKKKNYTKKDIESKMTNITKAKIIFYDLQGKNLYEDALQIHPLVKATGENKEYRMENTYVNEYFMRLGKLAVNSKIEKKYPNLSLEYRYAKNKDKEEYVVFKKITMDTSEYLKTQDTSVYYHDRKDGSLLDKQLSVVVILNNEKEEYVFSIDLNVNKVGDTHE